MADTLNIEILEEIGGWGFSFRDMYSRTKGFKGSLIRVPVNSYGGSVLEALLIYNHLRGHAAKVETHIPAFAMSAGTIIAAAGDKVTMSRNGYFMIHNPWAGVVGEADDMEGMAEVLGKMKKDMVDIYHLKTKKGKKEIAKMMDEETWLTAQEALDFGFVDELTDGAKIEASYDPKRFAEFSKVPQDLQSLFAAAGKKKSAWGFLLDELKNLFASGEQADAAPPATGGDDNDDDFMKKEDFEAMQDSVKQLVEEVAALRTELDASKTHIEAQEAEIAALKKLPAAKHTAGDGSTPPAGDGGKDVPAYLKNPLYLKAKAAQEARKKA